MRNKVKKGAPITRPLTIRAADKVEVEDVSSALTTAEYESVRAESLQSFVTSQSIIQWSLATYGVLFGAGLIATGNSVGPGFGGILRWMATLIYAILLPGLISAAAWSWIGEIRRMERTGAYLRGFERRIRQATAVGTSSVFAPLNWEAFLMNAKVKGLAPYLGTAMLFFGAMVISAVFGGFWISRVVAEETWHGWVSVVVAFGIVIFLIFMVESVRTGLQVYQLGRKYYDFDSGTLKYNNDDATTKAPPH